MKEVFFDIFFINKIERLGIRNEFEKHGDDSPSDLNGDAFLSEMKRLLKQNESAELAVIVDQNKFVGLRIDIDFGMQSADTDVRYFDFAVMSSSQLAFVFVALVELDDEQISAVSVVVYVHLILLLFYHLFLLQNHVAFIRRPFYIQKSKGFIILLEYQRQTSLANLAFELLHFISHHILLLFKYLFLHYPFLETLQMDILA